MKRILYFLLESSHALLSGLSVSAIVIKTGSNAYDESDCRAVIEICDNLGNCCATSPNGQGLDNPGDDRERGQTDVYTSRSVLNTCAQEVTLTLTHTYLNLESARLSVAFIPE